MKREFIKNLLPEIDKSILDQIMDEAAKDVQAKQQEIQALTTERDGLQTQLTDASKQIKAFEAMDVDGIKKSVSDWEAKYTQDTTDLRKQLADVQYKHAAEAAASGLKFTSGSAKKAFMSDLTAKQLEIKDGALSGFDDYLAEYKKSDPDCFQGDQPDPSFSQPGGLGGSPSGMSRAAQAARAAGGRFSPDSGSGSGSAKN